MLSVRLRLLFSLSLLAAQFLSAQNSTVPDVRVNMLAQLRYVEQFKVLAMAERERTGIPASITLAQAILETNGGQSLLAREANNHFGTKCSAQWKGKTFFKNDDETDVDGNPVESCFRLYTRPQDSYADHSKFLKRRRYAFLWKLDPTDYHGWATGLDTAGYSFAEGYGQKLIDIIDRYHLYLYDDQKSAGFTGEANALQRRLGWLNNTPVVLAEEGETPAGLARAFGLSPADVVRFNDEGYDEAEALPEGTFIFLAEKADDWQGRFVYHTVLEGETLFSIAQVYGIRMDALRRRNRFAQGEDVQPGDKVQIREPLPEPPPAFIVTNETPAPESFDILLTDAEAQRLFPVTTEDEEEEAVPTIQLSEDAGLYTVQPGDTLFSIAKRFNTSVEQLKVLNKMGSTVVKTGQKIKTR